MRYPKGKKGFNIVFRTNQEFLIFRALCFLKKKTQNELIMEWLENDMESKPDLAGMALAILEEKEALENG
jgi:hypothetical protein